MEAMPKKQEKKAKTPQLQSKDRLIEAAFALSATQGWALTSARDIADEAGLSLSEFYDVFDCKEDILLAYGRRLDRKVLETFSDYNPETPVRDLIFDILMERFDLANQDKPAILSILSSFRTDPGQALLAFPQLGASMSRMLEAAGVSVGGIAGAARVAGLALAVTWVTKTWLEDDSPDLTRTMAALDKALSKIESLADRFNL